MGSWPGQAARAGETNTGTRLVDRIRILVDHARMQADALDGFPRSQFSGEKALYASTDEEGFFILQVQARQYGGIGGGPVMHVSCANRLKDMLFFDLLLTSNIPQFVLYRIKTIQLILSLRIRRVFCGLIGRARILKALKDKVAVLCGKFVRHQ